MTDPKAPLPDEQTTIDLNRLFGDELKEIRDISLRLDANIAAQAEKIAELEERLEVVHCYVLDDKTGEMVKHEIAPEERDLMPDGIACRDETIKLQDKRIAELEAENFKLSAGQCPIAGGLVGDDHGHQYCKLEADNKRLREALKKCEDMAAETLTNHTSKINAIFLTAKSALAQTEQQPAPCKTCGGDKWIDSYKDGLMVRVECHTCNGTGREVK